MSGRHTILVRHKLGLIEELRAMADLVDATVSVPPLTDPVLMNVTILITSGLQDPVPGLVAACPQLALIHCMGAGYEKIDFAEAAQRKIMVSHGEGANATSVADHAVALLLGLLRRIPELDRYVREKRWQSSAILAEVAERRIGIIGMGMIGQQIAKRLAAFDVPLCYTARGPKPNLPYRYCATIRDLAALVDTLIVACPETPETRHIVNTEVLDRLQQPSLLINVARGAVVDTAALIAALQNGAVAGAALDVIEDEPAVPETLRSLRQVILSPHVAGATRHSLRRMQDIMIENISSFVGGRGPLTPVRLS